MEKTGVATPGGRPLIIPLFIPHQGCPHQCVFCNQGAITGTPPHVPDPNQIRSEVNRFLAFVKKRPVDVQVAFFGGNFLGLAKPTMMTMLATVASLVQVRSVDSIRFSTRPDSVRPTVLDSITPFPISTVELGVQSMNDSVLQIARRGHTAMDTVGAAALLKARGYRIGLQMMVGLPGDSATGAMETAKQMAALEPDFVRIYPTLVLKGSPLAGWLAAGRYTPLPLATCVTLVKQLYLFFKSRHIPVIRMGIQAAEGLTDATALLAGPHHPAFGHLVHGQIVLDAIVSVLERMTRRPDPLTIIAHPFMVSRVQGLNKRNLETLKKTFGLQEIILQQDRSLGQHRLVVAEQIVSLP